MTPPTVELDALRVHLGGREILRGLTGRFAGRTVGLLGPNGSGKTTLVHTLMGFHKPSSGAARVLGMDVATDGRRVRAEIGYMPERDAFVSGMTAVRFVRMMGEISGLPPAVALERAHESLFYVGLGEARYRPMDSYSLGMKQMAKLAQAIVHGPRLLYLDEPTNGMDPPHRKRMLELIGEIKATGETTVFISSHLLKDVEEVADEVMILKDGEIAATCDLEAERKANTAFIDIETTVEVPGFDEALASLGCQVAQPGRKHYKLVLPDGVDTKEIFRIAEASGAQLRHLDTKRNSLNDLFFDAMEGRLDAASGGN